MAHHYDVVYVHQPEMYPWFYQYRTATVCHFHNILTVDASYSRYALGRSYAFRLLMEATERQIVRRSAQVITVDRQGYEYYTSRFPQFASRITHIWPSVDLSLFRPNSRSNAREVLGIPATNRVIAYVGRLSQKKGLDLILPAIDILCRDGKPTSFVVAGDGELAQLLRSHPFPPSLQVVILGAVPHHNLAGVYNAADVVAVGSYHESVGLVTLEALACGRPVVATPVGIAPEVLLDGVTGFIVRNRNPEEFGSRLASAAGISETSTDACQHAARRYARSSAGVFEVLNKAARMPDLLHSADGNA